MSQILHGDKYTQNTHTHTHTHTHTTTVYLKFNFSFLAMLHSMWNLIYPTSDQPHAPCSGSNGVLTNVLPGKFQNSSSIVFYLEILLRSPHEH